MVRPDAAEVGRRLRQRRKALGLSQTRLAVATGLATNTVSRIERGEMRPGRQVREHLAEVLSIDPAVLVGEDTNDA